MVTLNEEKEECRGQEILGQDGLTRCAGDKVKLRVSRTKLEPNMRCYEKNVEPICAPLNCRYSMLTKNRVKSI